MIALALLSLIVSANEPYVRSRVSPGSSRDHCLYWPEDTLITWRPNGSGNDETPGDNEFVAFEKSFETWNTVLNQCASLRFSEGARTSSRTIGWASDNPDNQNIIVFRQQFCTDVVGKSDGCWDDKRQDCGNIYDCWQHQAAAIAITTTTYNPKSGQIYDADIELNTPSFIFSTVDAPICPTNARNTSCVAWDVQNTVTHEIGHMLGLDHTTNPGSTMNPTAPPGETSKRSLDDGTASFPCAAYPRGSPSRDCVIIPVSSTLGAPKGGCSATDAMPLLAGAIFWLTRRRRA